MAAKTKAKTCGQCKMFKTRKLICGEPTGKTNHSMNPRTPDDIACPWIREKVKS